MDVMDEQERTAGQVSGRDVAAQLAASGALDEVFARIDSGEVEMTGTEGLIPGRSRPRSSVACRPS